MHFLFFARADAINTFTQSALPLGPPYVRNDDTPICNTNFFSMLFEILQNSDISGQIEHRAQTLLIVLMRLTTMP
jgi:hypothetical protein